MVSKITITIFEHSDSPSFTLVGTLFFFKQSLNNNRVTTLGSTLYPKDPRILLGNNLEQIKNAILPIIR